MGIGAVLAQVAVVFHSIVGFFWYPVKRILRNWKAGRTKQQAATEEQKESAVQEVAIRMLGGLFSILDRVAFILAVPLALVILGSPLDLYRLQEAMRGASNTIFIVASTVPMIGVSYCFR